MKKILIVLFILLALGSCAGTRTPTPKPTQTTSPTSSVIRVTPVAGDDTMNIQAAFNKVPQGLANWGVSTIIFEPGVYEVNGTLLFKSKYRAILYGQGAIFTGNFSINASGAYADFWNFNLHSTSINPAFIYGRDVNGSGGNIRMHYVQVFTSNNIGAVLLGQADTSMLDHVEISNGGNAPSLIITSQNETGLLDYPSSTATFIEMRSSWIHGNGQTLIAMRGLIQKVIFDSVFFSPNSAAVTIESGQAYNLTFLNSGSEGLADAVLLRVMPGTYAGSVATINYTHSVINSQFVFDIQGIAENWDIPVIYRSSSVQKLFNVSGSLTDSDVYAYAGDIVSTGIVKNNRITGYGGDPIAGTTGGYNRIAYRSGVESVSVLEVTGWFSYADADVLKLNNVNLTHLATQTPNQIVVIVCDQTSTISGGYFIGISDPFVCNGEVMRFISLSTWYWTKID